MAYHERLGRFQALMGSGIDLAYFPFSADLQYLTGIPRSFPNFGAVLHPGAWMEGAWIAPHKAPVLTLPRMTAEFGGLADIEGIELRVLGDWDDPAVLVKDIAKSFNLPEKPRIAISDRSLGETVAEMHHLFPNAVFSSATAILRKLRVIKSEDEIATMRKAGEITEAAFKAVLANLKHGMTELEVISEVDFQLKRHGSLGPSFTTSLYNSGPNHPLTLGKPLETWQRVLTPPVSILFDFGGIYEGYCYDYGRTVFFGDPPEEARRVHRLIMEAQSAGIAALQAGKMTTTQTDAAARKVIEDAGYGKAFRHRLGHAIGLDVHEPPFLTAGDETLLQEGMLFTIEPSILQDNNFSARIEDVVVARPNGGEPLTRGYLDLIVVD
jgi:Xaa-Pro aminopeptidase